MQIAIQDLQNYFQYSIAANLLLIAVFAILWIFARGYIFPALWARIKGRPILVVIRKDNSIALRVPNYEAGDLSDGTYGDYIIARSENPEYASVFSFPHGLAGAFVLDNVGMTLSPRLAYDIEKIRDAGILNTEEFELLLQRVERKEDTEEDKNIMKRFQSVNLTAVENFFKYNLNPNFYRSRLERRVARTLLEQRQIPWKWILIFLLIVLVGAVIYLMFSNPAVQQQIANLGKSVTGGVTNTVNPGPGGMGIK